MIRLAPKTDITACTFFQACTQVRVFHCVHIEAIQGFAIKNFTLTELDSRARVEILPLIGIGLADPFAHGRSVFFGKQADKAAKTPKRDAGCIPFACRCHGKPGKHGFGGDFTCTECRVQAVNKHHLLAARQAVKVFSKRSPIAVAQREAPISSAARIWHDPVRAPVWQGNALRGFCQQITDALFAVAIAKRDGKGNLPCRIGVDGGAKRRIARLANFQHFTARRTRHLNIQKRCSGLEDERFEALNDTFITGAFGQRGHKIIHVSDAVFKTGHVEADAVPERVFAEIVLEH